MLIRGKSHVSAMIARIGDEEGNFSHIALVGEDKNGKQYVVESLIQYGVVVTPLEKWRQAEDARVALYRHSDEALAKKAARIMYDHGKKALDKNKGIRYDFSMNDDDYSTMFCSEVVRYAYDKASNGEVMIPKYRSTTTKFKGTTYLADLGVSKDTLFAPYDIEVDPRFDFVAEFRHYPLLRQVRMQDAVMQSMYSWMTDKGYEYHWTPEHALKAYLAKLLRQLGMLKTTLPAYMPMNSLRTNVRFEAVALTLQENIYKKEDDFYKKNGYLPSFQDMLQINEEYRKKDCELNQQWKKDRERAQLYDQPEPFNESKLHYFFYNKSEKCE